MKRIKSKVENVGLGKTIYYGIRYIFGVYYNTYYLMVNNIDINEISDKLQKYETSEVVELKYEDFLKGDPSYFTPTKMKGIKSRFESGDFIPYGLVRNNTLVISGWINTKYIRFPVRYYESIPLQNDEVFFQDDYCHRDFRRMGFHTLINLYRLRKTYEMNRSQAYVVINDRNIPSLKTQLKTGFNIFRKNRFLTFVWLKRTCLFEDTIW